MKNLAYFLFVLLFFSCSKKDKTDELPPLQAAEAKTITDFSYGSDAYHKMDIYLPAHRSTAATKSLVMIHGGAWAEGDKSDFNELIPQIQKLLPGYAIFNVNYVLSNGLKNNFPAQENNIKDAVKFIYDKRNEFIISDRLVYLGASAGAHLAMLQAYKSPNNSLVKPKAVVDFFGPADITALYNTSNAAAKFALQLLLNGTPSSNAALYNSSSPINYVNAQSPPTIILQGGLDDVVPKEQSFALHDKLQSSGVETQLVYYENQVHGWSDPAIVNDSFTKIIDFLKANVP